MASITNRVQEANKFMENGHKFMKTSLFKWEPDHDNAANQFNQAAMTFRSSGLHQKALEAYELAVKCYLASEHAFQAAKCLEQAALCSKETGDMQSVSKYFMRAIDLFRTRGDNDTAISTMDRAAKSLTDALPAMAADIYVQASEACCIEDRFRQAADFCNRAGTLYVKAKDYFRAANMLKEEINCYHLAGDNRNSDKTILSLVLVSVADKNVGSAQEVLKSQQMNSETFSLAESLIKAFSQRDDKTLTKVLNHSLFKNLDTEYAKIAREILNKYGTVEDAGEPKKETDPNANQEIDEDQLL